VVLPLVSAFHLALGGWQLRLHLERWVAPSTYLATIVSEERGPRVTIGHPVTLRVDRLSRCTPVRCGLLRGQVGSDVDVAGSFETNTHGGPIAFRARTVTELPHG
jgi:hypothetical protein